MLRSILLSTACRATPGEQSAAGDGDGDGVPEFLKRDPNAPGQVTAKSAEPKTETKDAKPAKAARVPTVKEAKAKLRAEARTGKVVKAKHKKADVVATEDNPQKSIVPVRFKAKYAEHDDSNGDRVALALKSATTAKNADGRTAVDLDALTKIAADNGIDMKAYAHLNTGMKRMNVGNRLRGMLKNEKPVTIGKQRFADWEKAKVVAPVKAA